MQIRIETPLILHMIALKLKYKNKMGFVNSLLFVYSCCFVGVFVFRNRLGDYLNKNNQINKIEGEANNSLIATGKSECKVKIDFF